ncbi:MAG: hypothetical protein M3Q97_09735, partial [Bacteroidota bacterium]|nr:hypothetical protein [Bacteroidota bacterium]
MKHLISLCVLLMLLSTALCAQPYCNRIQNPRLTGSNSGSSNPFAIGNVPNWQVVVHTPVLSGISRSASTSGAVW